jgi:phospholipase D1/2
MLPQERMRRHGRLVPGIESLRADDRTLAPLVTELPEELDVLVPDASVLDPEEPFDANAVLSEFVPREASFVPYRLFATGALLAAALGAAVAWRWSPLRQWLDIGTLTALARSVAASPLAPLLV